jgi:hypothetical protein
MRSRINVYAILAILSAITVVATLILARSSDAATLMQVRIQSAIQPVNAFGTVAAFFVIPAIVRTISPEFKMTLGRILVLVGIGIVLGVVIDIGFVLLIVPGVWFLVKWCVVTWCYLLSDGKNPFGESWEITTGHFWETLGFLLLLSLLVAGVALVAYGVPIFIAMFVPAVAVIAVPIALLGYVYVYHVATLAQMRWMVALREIFAESLSHGLTGSP